MTDMTRDTFAALPFGKAALQKLAPLPENFRLYEAENLGQGNGMKVTGAEFRAAKRGSNKGKLSIMVSGSKRVAYLSLDEIRKHEPDATE
ncbi:MAG: hypothetical protein E7L31_18295 [Aeromonas sp.]|uniref:Uncharacterized protein n=1 Tax=Escherichia coli TaxID=562 RepID=A0A3L0W0H9_ECOLX|nr:hypothetical protein [Aeromonas caviae]MDH1848014.1 hypothetical protein [Aeromonas caviae]MDU7313300.1 hypothetical protein [Aeromonas sp.]